LLWGGVDDNEIARRVLSWISEAANGQHTNLSTILFAVVFALMMVFDVVLE